MSPAMTQVPETTRMTFTARSRVTEPLGVLCSTPIKRARFAARVKLQPHRSPPGRWHEKRRAAGLLREPGQVTLLPAAREPLRVVASDERPHAAPETGSERRRRDGT